MGEPKKTWRRILTQGALAPLGTPGEHFKSFFKSTFGTTGSLTERFLSNSFISSLTAVAGVAGGIYIGAQIGGGIGIGLGIAAIIPSYIAASATCIGVIAAGSAITGIVHGSFKVLRNVFERENLIYGPEPKPLAPTMTSPKPAESKETAQPDFATAASPAPTTEDNLKKLDKILGEHKRRPMPPTNS